MIIYSFEEEGAVVRGDAWHRGLALLLLSSPLFWETQVLPRGIFDNVKRDGAGGEGWSPISSKTIQILLFSFY